MQTSKEIVPFERQDQSANGLGVLNGSIPTLAVYRTRRGRCAFSGMGLTMEGGTGWCDPAILMTKMPWTRVADQPCRVSANRFTSN